MTTPRISRRRLAAGLVGMPGLHGFGEGVVDFEDDAFGAVVAVELLLVLALYDGEGVQDVGHGGAGRGERLGQGGGLLPPLGLRTEVEVEEGGVQLAAEQEAALLVPTERAGPVEGLREGFTPVRGAETSVGTSASYVREEHARSAAH